MFLEKFRKKAKPSIVEKETKEKGKLKMPKRKKEIKIEQEKWFEPEGELAVDVYQTEKEIIIEAPVAGVKIEDLDVTLDDDVIKIRGKRERHSETESRNYLIQECHWGLFSKSIILPVEIDGSKIDASIKEGVLTIKVAKIEGKREKKIKIKEK